MNASAELLRAAAARVRERAAAIPEPSHHVTTWDVVVPMVGQSSLGGTSLAPAGDWIALLAPAIAEPLAAWLDWAAVLSNHAVRSGGPGDMPGLVPALATARALLGADVAPQAPPG